MIRPATDVRLGGRYVLTSRIAGGGMGEVWRADDTLLARPVAIKVLRAEYADDDTFVARFRLEARHTASLSHPGIAQVYDYGETDGVPYLVMELVPGEPLSAMLTRGRLAVDQALDVIAHSARALQAAHDQGVVHRDVKPGNLLVTPDGRVKVTDFGIARATGDSRLTRTGTVLGSAHYLSPEGAAGRRTGPASDIYALGVVAYECLTGRRPFTGDSAVAIAYAHTRETPVPLPDELPAAVRDLVTQMLAKDPGGRPSSAMEVARRAEAARRALRDTSSRRLPVSPPEPGGATPVPYGLAAFAAAAYADAEGPRTPPAPLGPRRPVAAGARSTAEDVRAQAPVLSPQAPEPSAAESGSAESGSAADPRVAGTGGLTSRTSAFPVVNPDVPPGVTAPSRAARSRGVHSRPPARRQQGVRDQARRSYSALAVAALAVVVFLLGFLLARVVVGMTSADATGAAGAAASETRRAGTGPSGQAGTVSGVPTAGGQPSGTGSSPTSGTVLSPGSTEPGADVDSSTKSGRGNGSNKGKGSKKGDRHDDD